jgi:hypothetical protein
MQQFKPRPAARIIKPRAHVVFPLPLPELTINRPRVFSW